jgi:hypothetical protein
MLGAQYRYVVGIRETAASGAVAVAARGAGIDGVSAKDVGKLIPYLFWRPGIVLVRNWPAAGVSMLIKDPAPYFIGVSLAAYHYLPYQF